MEKMGMQSLEFIRTNESVNVFVRFVSNLNAKGCCMFLGIRLGMTWGKRFWLKLFRLGIIQNTEYTLYIVCIQCSTKEENVDNLNLPLEILKLIIRTQ